MNGHCLKLTLKERYANEPEIATIADHDRYLVPMDLTRDTARLFKWFAELPETQ
jgi:hypothetical protein